MEEIRAIAIAKLKQASSNLWPDPVIGGIYDRDISTEQEGGTPAAWGPDPNGDPDDPLEPTILRPSMVIQGPNDVAPPNGATNIEDVHARNGFLRVYYYFPATSEGKITGDLMDRRTKAALNGYMVTLSTGWPVHITALDATESMDSPIARLTKVKQRRFLCEWMQEPD
jgi:hypothetical protein